MASLDVTLKPIPRKDVDYRNLKLQPTPEEYFLLSRVTGHISISEICAVSTMSKEQTLVALERLEQAGLIEIPRRSAPSFGEERVANAASPPPPASPPSSPGAPRPAAAPQPPPQAPAPTSAPAQAAAHAPEAPGYPYFPVGMQHHRYDAQALAEPVDLDEAVKRELLYVHDHLDRVDYYALLSLSRDADRKDVRQAFFTLSKRFHPDLFYGKELGSFKARVDAIFNQINKAQQVLSHKQKRDEYDASLGSAPATPQAPRAQAPAPQAQAAAPAASAPAASAPSPDPGDARKREMAFTVLVRRGEKHEAEGSPLEAAAAYRDAFGVKPEASVALRAAGLLMRQGQGHMEEAIALARAVLRAHPEEVRAHLVMGDAYEELGRLDEARSAYEAVLRLDPQSKVAQQRRRYIETLRR